MEDQKEMFPGHQSARKAAAAGIATAVRSANLQSEGWADRARAYLTDYARDNLHFTIEDVRDWAHNHATPPLSKPPTAMAWGGVALAAARMGTIVADGYGRTKLPPQHKKTCTRWRSNVTSADTPIIAPLSPDKNVYHLMIGDGRIACGAHRRIRSAAARAALLPAESKAGVTCLRCRGTNAYLKAK